MAEPPPPRMPQWDLPQHAPNAPPLPWPLRFKQATECGCKGPRTIAVLKKSNGTTAYKPICDQCGQDHDEIAHRTLSLKQKNEARPATYGGRAPWVQEIVTRWRAKWWVVYKEYLLSPEWRLKRKEVLGRDWHTCCFCRKAPATQVHHLTYERVGDEPLEDLVSSCKPCHEEHHSRRRVGLPFVEAEAGEEIPHYPPKWGPLSNFEILIIEETSGARVIRDHSQPDTYVIDHAELSADDVREMYDLNGD